MNLTRHETHDKLQKAFVSGNIENGAKGPMLSNYSVENNEDKEEDATPEPPRGEDSDEGGSGTIDGGSSAEIEVTNVAPPKIIRMRNISAQHIRVISKNLSNYDEKANPIVEVSMLEKPENRSNEEEGEEQEEEEGAERVESGESMNSAVELGSGSVTVINKTLDAPVKVVSHQNITNNETMSDKSVHKALNFSENGFSGSDVRDVSGSGDFHKNLTAPVMTTKDNVTASKPEDHSSAGSADSDSGLAAHAPVTKIRSNFSMAGQRKNIILPNTGENEHNNATINSSASNNEEGSSTAANNDEQSSTSSSSSGEGSGDDSQNNRSINNTTGNKRNFQDGSSGSGDGSADRSGSGDDSSGAWSSGNDQLMDETSGENIPSNNTDQVRASSGKFKQVRVDTNTTTNTTGILDQPKNQTAAPTTIKYKEEFDDLNGITKGEAQNLMDMGDDDHDLNRPSTSNKTVDKTTSKNEKAYSFK